MAPSSRDLTRQPNVSTMTSGYAEDLVKEDPAAHSFKASLRKPFAMSDLSELLEEHVPPRRPC